MHIILLKSPHVQIAFLKFTSCDNLALVGCILIAAVAIQFEAEIIKIGQSSHNMYSNNIVNFQESMTILNACTKKLWKPIECMMYIHTHPCIPMYIYTHTYIYIYRYIHTHPYIYIYTYKHTHTHLYIYIYTYKHTHLYIYIYIYLYICTHTQQSTIIIFVQSSILNIVIYFSESNACMMPVF